MVKVSVSLLSMREKLLENIDLVNTSDADYIHLDIMDNEFVPFTSFNDEETNAIIKNSKKELDVHLMVNDLEKYIKRYSLSNTKYITVHYEAIDDYSFIDIIKKHNVKVGLSLKPTTNIEEIFPFLENIDLILVMSVEPGRGGQKFLESTYERISRLKQEIISRNLNVEISVDGGINSDNIGNIINVGTTTVVVGSYLTTSGDIINSINNIKKCKI